MARWEGKEAVPRILSERPNVLPEVAQGGDPGEGSGWKRGARLGVSRCQTELEVVAVASGGR